VEGIFVKELLVSVAAVVPAVVLGMASSAQAATPKVSLTYIYFDSPGSDNRSNASLNKEYVRITNNTGAAIQLKGYTLRDKANHVFTFKPFSLGAHKNVWVHTGKGTDGRNPSGGVGADVYYNSGNYVWNNDGDTATLKTSTGALLDTCKYSGAGSAIAC
jgi:hypothetical protein